MLSIVVAAGRFDSSRERYAFGGRSGRSLSRSKYVGQGSFESTAAASPVRVHMRMRVYVLACRGFLDMMLEKSRFAPASSIGNVGSLAAGRRAAGLISAARGAVGAYRTFDGRQGGTPVCSPTALLPLAFVAILVVLLVLLVFSTISTSTVFGNRR